MGQDTPQPDAAMKWRDGLGHSSPQSELVGVALDRTSLDRRKRVIEAWGAVRDPVKASCYCGPDLPR